MAANQEEDRRWLDCFVLYPKPRFNKTVFLANIYRVCKDKACKFSSFNQNKSHYHCKLCDYTQRGFFCIRMRKHVLSKHKNWSKKSPTELESVDNRPSDDNDIPSKLSKNTCKTSPKETQSVNDKPLSNDKPSNSPHPSSGLRVPIIPIVPKILVPILPKTTGPSLSQSIKTRNMEKRVLLTGISALDIVIVCEKYPKEDEKGKATSHYRQKGGNVANSAEILSRLGTKTSLFSYFEKEENGIFVKNKLESHGVDTSLCVVQDKSGFPTSYCILSKETFSRTVLHSRSKHYEPKFKDFVDKFGQNLFDYTWFHFEGRSFPDICQIIQHVYQQRNNFQGIMSRTSKCFVISAELERVNSKDELLTGVLPYADLVFVSRDFAINLGYSSAVETVSRIKSDQNLRSDVIVIVPWGKDGADAIDGNNVLHHCDAYQPERYVDTIGAGDTFNAAIIYCLLNGWLLPDALDFACKLAGKKCGMYGFDKLIS